MALVVGSRVGNGFGGNGSGGMVLAKRSRGQTGSHSWDFDHDTS
jgi:hypothetical protein